MLRRTIYHPNHSWLPEHGPWGLEAAGGVTRLVVRAPDPGTTPRLRRLAALPFSNLSGDSSQQYFSDGVTEELITPLGRVCQGDMGIVAHYDRTVSDWLSVQSDVAGDVAPTTYP